MYFIIDLAVLILKNLKLLYNFKWQAKLLLCYQNLPALVLKIMSGTFAPISDRYSPQLRQLILNILNLDPSKRPQLNEIMAHPICIRPLLNLYTDIGNVKMRRHDFFVLFH